MSSNQVTALWLPAVTLSLSPPSAAQSVGGPYNATLLATDGAGHPVVNLTVAFQILAGPNAGLTGLGTTGANGQALFTYTSAIGGADTLNAAIGLTGGAGYSGSVAAVLLAIPSPPYGRTTGG